jgi:hypothetical protein
MVTVGTAPAFKMPREAFGALRLEGFGRYLRADGLHLVMKVAGGELIQTAVVPR